jgi:crotonobetainyl-CoA:carnitine CoA-transferase CaiB-like acyl-CoA transferase
MAEVLKGVRVIEAASFVSGPYVGQLLGELGADVIKVESPRGGDPFRGGDLYNAPFRSYNPNKRSITIDLQAKGGAALFRKLCSTADILVENYRPGVMDKLGIGCDVLRQDNPRLIYCAVTGFGPDGPSRHRPAYDSVGSAISGYYNQTMFADKPQIVGPAVADAVTGLYGVYGVLGALYEREKTGVGRRVDITMLESMIVFLRQPIESYFDTGKTPEVLERPSYSTAFAFQCADGKPVAIHTSAPEKFWVALTQVVERPEMATDPRYADRAGRIANFVTLTEELRPIFRQRNRAEWMARLEQNDVPFAPINNFDEVREDAQVKHLGTFAKHIHEGHGEMERLNRPVFYDGDREIGVKPPPYLGEHTDQVLAELGLDEAERTGLREAGVLG